MVLTKARLLKHDFPVPLENETISWQKRLINERVETAPNTSLTSEAAPH